MNRGDQNYLLNSEILVIVSHMLEKRQRELRDKRTRAAREEEQIEKGETTTEHHEAEDEKEGEEGAEPVIVLPSPTSSQDGGSLSSVELSYYSGIESPPLSESDLCDTDVDTEELIDSSDCEEETTLKSRPQRRLKKRGGLFQFMLNKARKWKGKKKPLADKTGTSSRSNSIEMTSNFKLSTVCDSSREDSGLADLNCPVSVTSESAEEGLSSAHLNPPVTQCSSTILDPRSLITQSNNKQITSPSHVNVGVTTPPEHNGRLNGNVAVHANRTDTMSGEDSHLAGKANQLPVKSILKCRMVDGYGLSEGDIRPHKMNESDSSINSILSEEEHLLADYVHNLSQLSKHQRERMTLQDDAINKLVSSLEQLPICGSPESLSQAVYRSLVDLREKNYRLNIAQKGDEDISSYRHSYHGAVIGSVNAIEDDDDDYYCIDSLSLLELDHVTTASGEDVNSYTHSCDSNNTDPVYSPTTTTRDCDSLTPTTQSKKTVINSLTDYIKRFPKSFQKT